MNRTELVAADFGARARKLAERAVMLLGPQGQEYAQFCQAIHDSQDALQANPIIKVAFVGQYGAGKSTIISALTGNKDIKIDADIATDQTMDYPWSGVLLTDTPGLYTERPDHDAIAYNAIQKADLLVFAITSDLFDDLIMKDFIKLAFEEGYRHKMLLVVNKMSMEKGDYSHKVSAYSDSLNSSLFPHPLREFMVCFIDAADHLEGLQEGIPELVELSHFPEFIDRLNRFISVHGLLGRVDTPIRGITAELEKALVLEGANEVDHEFFIVLSRIEDRVKRSQKNAEAEVARIISTLRMNVIQKGASLALRIGEMKLDFTLEQEKLNVEIEGLCDQASEQLEQSLTVEQDSLNLNLDEMFQAGAGELFIQRIQLELDKNYSVQTTDLNRLRQQMGVVNGLLGKASGKVLSLAEEAGKGSKLVKTKEIVGTELHEMVKKVGGLFGKKFKPYQAARLSKNLVNVAKVIGPILAFAPVVIDGYEMYKESDGKKKVLYARDECAAAYVQEGQRIEEKFQKQFENYKAKSYSEVLAEISQQRDEAIRKQVLRSDFEKEVGVLLADAHELVKDIDLANRVCE